MKKFKAILCLFLALVLALTLVSCGSNAVEEDDDDEPKAKKSRSAEEDDEDEDEDGEPKTRRSPSSEEETDETDAATESITTVTEEVTETVTESVSQTFKAGFLILHDENSVSDKNFIDAARAACASLGVECIIKTFVNESSMCTDACNELIAQGCGAIFGTSFGYEDFMLQAAKQNPNVQFYHISGVKAHTEMVDNFHNGYAAVYEGRYLTGVAAGMKLNELKNAGKLKGSVPKVGFVAAYTYAEVVSAYTAFFLGVRSVCPDAVMDVTFVGAWYDQELERAAAQKLIAGGCDLLSQTSDSMGVPSECEKAGVPNVGYNLDGMETICPNTFIVSCKINWQPYFESAINAAKYGRLMARDYTGTLNTGSVELSAVNPQAAAQGTAAKLVEIRGLLKSGTLHVFDTSAFTVNGEKLTSYIADVNYDDEFTPDTEVISNGYFHESEYRSAPYFAIQIDGITLLG